MKTRLNSCQQPMKLLIADAVDHARDSLAAYLQLQGLEIVGKAANAAEAIHLTHQYHPDVVIMDISLPDMDGFTATQKLAALANPPTVFLLTVRRRPWDLSRAIEAGASVCIEKSGGIDAVLDALHRLSLSVKEADATQKRSSS